MAKAGVVVFPGSNCDRDVEGALAQAGFETVRVWHGDASLPDGLDVIALPGGFSYGDYLRCGAMAAHSPIVSEVKGFADKGGYVLGICNGFQVLCETGLVPGALMRNANLKFICKNVDLCVEETGSAYTSEYSNIETITIPVAHHDGNYFADEDTIKAMQDNGQIAFRYANAEGAVDEHSNPNGSAQNIAGVLSENKRVLGLMPHPERHADKDTGGIDGAAMFSSLFKAVG